VTGCSCCMHAALPSFLLHVSNTVSNADLSYIDLNCMLLQYLVLGLRNRCLTPYHCTSNSKQEADEG
jgi:hypothetical protein